MSSEYVMARRDALQAMGLTLYAARFRLPGAAPSPRFLAAACSSAGRSAPSRETAPAPPGPDDTKAPASSRESARESVTRLFEARTNDPPAGPQGPSAGVVSDAAPLVPFTLASVALGGCLWLEELPDGVIGRDQVSLIRAICRALQWPAESAGVNQFAWPMHRNPQLDQGEDAALAALSAFISRQMQAGDCSRLVLLGLPVQQRLDGLTIGARVLRTQSTRDMLQDPRLKRQAWRDLRGA